MAAVVGMAEAAVEVIAKGSLAGVVAVEAAGRHQRAGVCSPGLERLRATRPI